MSRQYYLHHEKRRTTNDGNVQTSKEVQIRGHKGNWGSRIEWFSDTTKGWNEDAASHGQKCSKHDASNEPAQSWTAENDSITNVNAYDHPASRERSINNNKIERTVGESQNKSSKSNGGRNCDETDSARHDEKADGSGNEAERINWEKQKASRGYKTKEKWRLGRPTKKPRSCRWRFMRHFVDFCF